ncbi:hypothetical protein [Paenibacillus sp. EPM92]|uniref:hypothetical protein n=1 Tax=Paenibacillus sp. EPM92 TaxID=1561195 RepID=UPI0019156414|nr:hypothetical protein [Paenibacillus sp. EPM92]
MRYHRREPSMHRGEWSLDTALLLISVLGIGYTAILTALLCNLPPHAAVLTPIALVLWVIFGIAMHRWGISFARTSYALAILGVILSLFMSTSILDTSYDGQVYHILAISSIKEGWNPLYHSAFPLSIWIEHYAKAPWLLAAFFYAYWPSIEVGKATNVICWLASFFAAFGALARIFRNRSLFVLGLSGAVMAANPVVVAELFTYYNDGLLGSLMLVYIAALAHYAKTFERKSLILASVTLLLLLNIKFTAIVYAGLITFIFVVYLTFANRFKSVIVTLTLGLTFMAGVIGFGYNPYVTNTVHKGHPFYPLAGSGKIDIISANQPADFAGKGTLEKMVLSLTRKTGNPIQPLQSEPRDLFALDLDEIKTEFRHMDQDTRIGGFGPFMFWIALGSIALGFLLLAYDCRLALGAALAVAALSATVFINPESWWARYVPQFWLIPVVIALCGYVARHKVPKWAALLLLTLIGCNALGSNYRLVHVQVKNSQQLKAQLDALPVRLQIHREGEGFASVPLRLREQGIAFTYAQNELSCKHPDQIKFSIVRYCD